MPQFDFYTFLIQAFYILIAFFIFFYYVAIVLAKLAEVIKFREKFISQNKLNPGEKVNLYSLILKPYFDQKSKQISKFLNHK